MGGRGPLAEGLVVGGACGSAHPRAHYCPLAPAAPAASCPQILDLAANELRGTLPPLPLPSGLLEVYFYDNQLVGTIPPRWSLPPGLYRLVLGRNLLSGALGPRRGLPMPVCSVSGSGAARG